MVQCGFSFTLVSLLLDGLSSRRYFNIVSIFYDLLIHLLYCLFYYLQSFCELHGPPMLVDKTNFGSVFYN